MRTLVLVKPDGLKRALGGQVIARLLQAGLGIEIIKMVRMTPESAASLYVEHKGKEFYDALCAHMADQRGVLVAWVSGPNAVARARTVVLGVRKDLATSVRDNVAHAADSSEAADRELRLFFGEGAPQWTREM